MRSDFSKEFPDLLRLLGRQGIHFISTTSSTEDYFLRRFPIDAGVGDALAIDELVQRLGEFLGTSDEVAF